MATSATALFRHSRWDVLLVGAAFGYGAVLLLWPSIPVIAIGLWWCANTVSHNFIHLPFFRSRAANTTFSIYLSLLLGLPQTLWRQRHLAHHADRRWRFRAERLLLLELACVTALWGTLATLNPVGFLTIYLPGWFAGLALCFLQGHFEHAHGTTSHYGWFYNFLFFNDGFHVEHHQRPARHWRLLPANSDRRARASRWPAVLRWLDAFNLESLERCVLRSRILQKIVVALHERAFRRLIAKIPSAQRIAVVGGALFPRTAIMLRRVLPRANIVIIDCNHDHILEAKRFLNGCATYEHRVFESTVPADDFDLVIVPLAFQGDRAALYSTPPARAVLVHDWLWKRRGNCGAVVSPLLLKRLNLVLR